MVRKLSIDWWLIGAIIPILFAGLATMFSFTGDNSFASHQLVWILIAFAVLFTTSFMDVRFIRRTWVSAGLFFGSITMLAALTVLGSVSNGAMSWFDFGVFSFQPADFSKIALIIILAKYFSRRHIEIANVRHILISGGYAFTFFILVLLQPDLGSAITIALIWLGMIMVSGVSKKHLFAMIGVAVLTFVLLWSFAFKEYQKDRIRTFVDPSANIHTTGYNAYQSTVAVGSGGLFGKGLGYGIK